MPTIVETQDFHWPDEAACSQQAARLAAAWLQMPAQTWVVLELHGELGAGKTTFVRHLLRALGHTGRVKSPTYTVLEPYAVAGRRIAHFDFYRLADAREAIDAGLREVFDEPGLKLVEWPAKVPGLWPLADLALHIDVADDGRADGIARRVRADVFTPTGQALLR